jgi:hypothetical protein
MPGGARHRSGRTRSGVSICGRGWPWYQELPDGGFPPLGIGETSPTQERSGRGFSLIVEDEPLVRTLAVDSLTEAGFDVVESVDADEAKIWAPDSTSSIARALG